MKSTFGKTISFKSTEENYRKEESGIKPNTVRFTDDWDEKRWKEYEESTHVCIRLKGSPRTKFTREIKDKTTHKNVVIISWSFNHKALQEAEKEIHTLLTSDNCPSFEKIKEILRRHFGNGK